MLTKLICWVIGHKMWAKAATGFYDAGPNQLTGLDQVGTFYRWEKQKFCLRCGKEE